MPQPQLAAWITATVLSVCLLAASAFAVELSGTAEKAAVKADILTGEVLPVFYVADVRASVDFYRQLGFTFDHY